MHDKTSQNVPPHRKAFKKRVMIVGEDNFPAPCFSRWLAPASNGDSAKSRVRNLEITGGFRPKGGDPHFTTTPSLFEKWVFLLPVSKGTRPKFGNPGWPISGRDFGGVFV